MTLFLIATTAMFLSASGTAQIRIELPEFIIDCDTAQQQLDEIGDHLRKLHETPGSVGYPNREQSYQLIKTIGTECNIVFEDQKE